MTRLGVIGAGAWGTALALLARRAGADAVLWARRPEAVQAINERHANPDFLPGIALDLALRATGAIAEAAQADAILLAVPAQFVRAIATRLAPHLPAGIPVVSCAKGIEVATAMLMSEVLAETLPGAPIGALSGPNFAAEIARGLPAAATLAVRDDAIGRSLVAMLGSARFRPYLSDDVIGTEIAGAVKNVIAIACGISDGRGLGESARAALIARGLAEMTRLALAKGGRAATLTGLAGIGDLTLTCTGTYSRNRAAGIALGQGQTLDQALAGRRSVAEGVASAAAVVMLAGRLGVDMPIANAVDAILNRGAAIDATIAALLARPFRAEAGV